MVGIAQEGQAQGLEVNGHIRLRLTQEDSLVDAVHTLQTAILFLLDNGLSSVDEVLAAIDICTDLLDCDTVLDD